MATYINTHTHNSHPKRAQFSMTFPPQQKKPATWVHISTTWGLQHYQYDLYFDGRSFWNVFQSWTHWSFSGDSGGSSAHTERRGRTHEETTNGTAVVVRSQPFSCCWSCGRVLRFCLVETCGLGGGFEIYVYKYWRIPFVFLFRHHLFLNWWSWFAWFVDFFKRFPNQKMATKNSGIDFGTRRTWILGFVCFFFRCLWLPRMARSTVGAWARSRWHLRVFQKIFLVLKIEWKIVEVWRCLLFFLLSFLFVHAFELNKESLNKCEGILRRKGFEMFWYFWLISLIAGFSSIWGWFQSSSGRILTALWSRHVFQCFFQDETSAFFPGKPNYALPEPSKVQKFLPFLHFLPFWTFWTFPCEIERFWWILNVSGRNMNSQQVLTSASTPKVQTMCFLEWHNWFVMISSCYQLKSVVASTQQSLSCLQVHPYEISWR